MVTAVFLPRDIRPVYPKDITQRLRRARLALSTLVPSLPEANPPPAADGEAGNPILKNSPMIAERPSGQGRPFVRARLTAEGVAVRNDDQRTDRSRNLHVMVFLVGREPLEIDTSMLRRLQVAALALVMVLASPLTRAEETTAVSRLPIPEAVQSAARAAVPGFVIVRAEWNKEEYKIKLKGSDGDARVTLSPDGTVRRIECEHRLTKIPPRVQGAIRKAFPGGEIGEATRLTRTEISYAVEITRDGRKHEVRVTADGKLLEVEKK